MSLFPDVISNKFYKVGQWASGLFGKNYFWKKYRTYVLGTKGPIWIDTENPKEIYNETDAVKLVYDRFAAMYSNMKILKQNIKTEEIVEDVDLQKLLERPNPMQSQNAWLTNRCLQLLVYGNQFTRKIKPSILQKYPVTIWNPSPKFTKPVLTGKLFDQISIEGIVSKYEFNDLQGRNEFFETKDVLWRLIADLDDPLLGLSKMTGFKYPITNLKAAYEYLNAISTRKGGIGLLSNEPSKDSDGTIGLDTDEKDRIDKEHVTKYGISEGQKAIILTEASMKWTPMSYPTQQLLLLEQIDENTRRIIDSLHMNVNVFANKNSTYENVQWGLFQTYNDAIIPFADEDMQVLGPFLGVEEGFRLIASYEHLGIMKLMKRRDMEGVKSLVEWLDKAVLGKLLTGQEAVTILKNELGMR